MYSITLCISQVQTVYQSCGNWLHSSQQNIRLTQKWAPLHDCNVHCKQATDASIELPGIQSVRQSKLVVFWSPPAKTAKQQNNIKNLLFRGGPVGFWVDSAVDSGLSIGGCTTSMESASFLGGSGGILPMKILKIWVSLFPAFWDKFHTLDANFLLVNFAFATKKNSKKGCTCPPGSTTGNICSVQVFPHWSTRQILLVK